MSAYLIDFLFCFIIIFLWYAKTLIHLQTHFAESVFIDTDTLVKIGKEFGFDGATVKKITTDQRNIDIIHERAKDWVRQGVTSKIVPFSVKSASILENVRKLKDTSYTSG